MRFIINSITQPANVHKKFLLYTQKSIFMRALNDLSLPPIPIILSDKLRINIVFVNSKIAIYV
jgi:hypothetical protein